MKKYLIITVTFIITCFLIACNAKKSAILQPEHALSIMTGPPQKIEFSFDVGESLTQEVIEIYGYRIKKIEGLPKLPKLTTEEERHSIKMTTDSIEVYTPILSGNYYTIIISNGPNYLCTLYDSKGFPIHPFRNFQLMIPNRDKIMEPHICKIISKKDVRTENVIIGTEDFMYLQNTKLCSLCYIELDKKNRIVSSGKVIFPTFGAIGNVIQKKADPNAVKVYVKVVYDGMFGVSIKPCDEKLNIFSI